MSDTVRVLTQDETGTTAGHPVDHFNVRRYLEQAGRMILPSGSEEIPLQAIVTTEVGDFVIREHDSIPDCFVLETPDTYKPDEVPVQFTDIPESGYYSVGNPMEFGNDSFGTISRVILVETKVMELGVPETLQKVAGSRVLKLIQT